MNRAARILALSLTLAAPWAGLASAEVVALVGATVHPVSGPDIPNGVVVMDGARITAVGPASSVHIPVGARTVQVTDKHVYPGFIEPLGHIGLVEIESVRGSTDTRDIGENDASLRAQVAFYADSMLIGPAVAGGVLYSHIGTEGQVVNGTSAVMRLNGWNWEDMTLKAPIAMGINYPQVAQHGRFFRQTEEEFAKAKEKAVKALQDIVDASRTYQTARSAMANHTGPAIDIDSRFEAMMPVLEGKVPLLVYAADKPTIEAALDWAKKEKFTRLILATGADARLVADRLAKEKVSVILDGVLDLPDRRWAPYDDVYAAAEALRKAGVTFCIGDGGDASQARNLPFHAAMAAAFGLPRDVALRSVTLSPAEVLGVADRIGSIDVGKEASVFVSDGDPLEMRTHIEQVWIAGQPIDLAHERQVELYERYRHRPKATGSTPAAAPSHP
jgi:imidazolonepropionase-like amidohydrolase